MSDVKDEYSNTVMQQKHEAITDSVIADLIQDGYSRKETYGANWETVDINEIVARIAPNSSPIIENGKIIYYSEDGTRAVVADISGYIRIQDLTKNTRRRQYLDQDGNDAHNKVNEHGKIIGRSKDEYERVTHFIIKKRK